MERARLGSSASRTEHPARPRGAGPSGPCLPSDSLNGEGPLRRRRRGPVSSRGAASLVQSSPAAVRPRSSQRSIAAAALRASRTVSRKSKLFQGFCM